MSGHVAIDSHMPSSPFGSANYKHASVYAPDSIAVWHSSPSKPVTAPPNNYDFDIEELSDNDVDYPHGAQVLYPYELEEVETPAADHGHVHSPSDIGEGEEEEDTQDSDSTTFARRTRSKIAPTYTRTRQHTHGCHSFRHEWCIHLTSNHHWPVCRPNGC